jgi:hypothetical protein
MTSVMAACAAGLLNGCTKDNNVPENPFGPEVIVHDTDTTTIVIPDPYSITGLHKNIFSTRCNLPGCHDGSFEPDFRTVQSTYSTLVYHRVNKTVLPDSARFFTYRVIPFDTTYSFLHERVTTTTSEYMPSSGNRLTETEIHHINTWIMNGAKDINGNIPLAPNNLPNMIQDSGYFWAFDSLTFVPLYGNMISTIRYQGVPYFPFLVGAGRTMKIIFWVQDDSTALGNLLVNECKLSLLENDFSAAQTAQASYINFGFPLQFWMATFQVSWPPGTQVYFRYYVRDTDNQNIVEFPRSDMPFYYKSYFSFLVQ